MKTKLVLLFIILSGIISAQSGIPLGAGNMQYCVPYLIDAQLIFIDTNNVWFSNKPDKDILVLTGSDTLECGNIAILTDSNKYYSKKIDSYFQIAVRWNAGSSWEEFGLHFKHKYDFEKNKDGGIIEISYDSGLTWVNAIHDPVIVDTNFKGKLTGLYTTNDTVLALNNQPAFTGTVAELNEVVIPFSLANLQNPSEGAIIRFRMASDSIDSNHEGWMITSLTIDGWLEDAVKELDKNPVIELILDSYNILHISIQNEVIERIEIISLDGKVAEHLNSTDTIDISHLAQGIYIVKINNLFSGKIFKNE